MTRTNRRLLLAFLLSITLHALPFLPASLSAKSAPKPAPPLIARLKAPPLPSPEPILPPPPESTPPLAKPPPPQVRKKEKKADTAPRWENVVRQQMKKLRTAGKYYSKEAIDLNLEGDPVVLMVLDASGNITAARIEESSGHPILDRDALNAVRSLHYLPADAPREVILPLRFRLRD